MSQGKKFRELLKKDGIIVAPGGFSPLTCIIGERMGFECMYMTGYGAAAYRLGYPDVGLMTQTEALEVARAMARSVDIPVIADADTGYGNVVNIRRTVMDFEEAGVAGIQIEDQKWPKRCGHMEGKQLISAEEMCRKIEAAIAAKSDEDFVIIARTDSNTVLGFEEALRRSRMYREAGADVIFLESPVSEEQLRETPRILSGYHLMANMSEGGRTPIFSNAELEKMGYKFVIWPSSATWAIAKYMEAIYKEIMEKGTTRELTDKMILFEEFNKLVGLEDVLKWSERFA
jgi:2-methylisocitrate lyase-like PEP mutase family enzyme